MLRFLLLTAIALVFAGCGTTTKTKTVTVTRVSTVEIEVPPEPAVEAIPAVTDEDYCGSAAGDALAQADSEASDAFNDADPAAFKRALEKAMRAVRKAPDGSECAAQALNSIAFSANNGAGNLDGLDLTGIVKRIRRFQKVHDLPRRNQ